MKAKNSNEDDYTATINRGHRFDINDRVGQLLSLTGLTYEEFADMIGSKRPNIVNLKGNRYRPSIDTLQGIARAFPFINMRWVLLGGRQMSDDPNDTIGDLLAKIAKEVNRWKADQPSS